MSTNAPNIIIFAVRSVPVGIASTREQYGDTEYHCFAVPQNPVGQNTAEYGQEIYQGQESAEDCAGAVGTEAEFGLHEQHENSQHGIVAETLALRMSFEHICVEFKLIIMNCCKYKNLLPPYNNI